MENNIGSADKVIRIILGIILLTFLFKSFLILVALLLIMTALVNFCPLYKMAGVSTRKVTENTSDAVTDQHVNNESENKKAESGTVNNSKLLL